MVLQDLSWMTDAACKGVYPKNPEDPDIFFPEQGKSAEWARAICADCPVKAQCLEYGLWDSEGVFGGSTDAERRALRKERGGRYGQRERHGRRSNYVYHGCRCELCAEANAAYNRRKRRLAA